MDDLFDYEEYARYLPQDERGVSSCPEVQLTTASADDGEFEVETEVIIRDYITHAYHCWLSSEIPSWVMSATFVRVYREVELSGISRKAIRPSYHYGC